MSAAFVLSELKILAAGASWIVTSNLLNYSSMDYLGTACCSCFNTSRYTLCNNKCYGFEEGSIFSKQINLHLSTTRPLPLVWVTFCKQSYFEQILRVSLLSQNTWSKKLKLMSSNSVNTPCSPPQTHYSPPQHTAPPAVYHARCGGFQKVFYIVQMLLLWIGMDRHLPEEVDLNGSRYNFCTSSYQEFLDIFVLSITDLLKKYF